MACQHTGELVQVVRLGMVLYAVKLKLAPGVEARCVQLHLPIEYENGQRLQVCC